MCVIQKKKKKKKKETDSIEAIQYTRFTQRPHLQIPLISRKDYELTVVTSENTNIMSSGLVGAGETGKNKYTNPYNPRQSQRATLYAQKIKTNQLTSLAFISKIIQR